MLSLHPLWKCTSADKEEYSSGKKKGFKVSNLTMKTVPTNRYDIIMEGIIMKEW